MQSRVIYVFFGIGACESVVNSDCSGGVTLYPVSAIQRWWQIYNNVKYGVFMNDFDDIQKLIFYFLLAVFSTLTAILAILNCLKDLG